MVARRTIVSGQALQRAEWSFALCCTMSLQVARSESIRLNRTSRLATTLIFLAKTRVCTNRLIAVCFNARGSQFVARDLKRKDFR